MIGEGFKLDSSSTVKNRDRTAHGGDFDGTRGKKKKGLLSSPERGGHKGLVLFGNEHACR